MKLNSNFSIFELGINAPHEMKSLINILHPHRYKNMNLQRILRKYLDLIKKEIMLDSLI